MMSPSVNEIYRIKELIYRPNPKTGKLAKPIFRGGRRCITHLGTLNSVAIAQDRIGMHRAVQDIGATFGEFDLRIRKSEAAIMKINSGVGQRAGT